MLRGVHRGLGPTRIDDDDFGRPLVPHDPLPQDRMRDADVGSDEDHAVGLFKILIRVRRSIEAERLLVRDDRRRHALPRVAVAVKDSHPELGERTEQRHLFRRDLPRPEPSH